MVVPWMVYWGCRWVWLVNRRWLLGIGKFSSWRFLLEDGCLAIEAFGGKYDFLMHLMLF